MKLQWEHLNQYILNSVLHKECCKTSFVHCFIVIAKNLIPLMVFLFSCSCWLKGEYLFAVLKLWAAIQKMIECHKKSVNYVKQRSNYSTWYFKSQIVFCKFQIKKHFFNWFIIHINSLLCSKMQQWQ